MAGPLPPPQTMTDATGAPARLDDLRAAAALLEDRMHSDSFPDLGDLCRGLLDAQQKNSLPSDSDPPSPFSTLDNDGFLALPEFIFRQYESVQSCSYMGLFPEINRAWISIDSRLFIWNYQDTDPNSINVYDDQEQIILTAALAKPIPGVFLEQIEYVLVVSTPLEIILLGLAFSNKAKPDEPRSSMTIFRTDMSIPADNVNMMQIVTTDTGRIFMRGSDYQLYELEYDAREGWFTSKIRKTNHTVATGISMFLPSFLTGQRDRAVKFAAIDNALQALYVTTPQNGIDVYSLATPGSLPLCTKMDDVFAQLSRFSAFIAQSDLNERSFEIVSLHPVARVESASVNLAAVTSTGMRLYFTIGQQYDRFGRLSRDDTGAFGENMSLRLVNVRGPSSFAQDVSQYNAIGAARTHEAVYAGGIMIAAQAFSEEVDRIVGVSLNSGRIAASTPKYLSESCSFIDIDGKTWSICEAPSQYTRKCVELSANMNVPPGALLNELATQFEFPARRFLLLTNMGLTAITKLRPIDIFVRMLKLNQKQSLRFFEELIDHFGRDQSCAMCLGIAMGHPAATLSSSSLVTDSFSDEFKLLAARLYFEYGGAPTQAQLNNGVTGAQTGGGPLGLPVGTLQIRHSAKHDGLALYIGRVLRPIWKSELLKRHKHADESRWEVCIQMDSLVQVQTNLNELQKFFEHYPRLVAEPTPETLPSHLDPDAWRSEQRSFYDMHQLVLQSIETISFVSLLVDYKLPSIVTELTEAEQREVQGITFESLVSTPKGRDIGKLLMTLLINRHIEHQRPTDAIVETLRQQCPSIFQSNDAVYYNAMDLVQNAKTLVASSDQRPVLDQSLRLFMSIVRHMHVEKLRTVVENYKSLRFFNGVVDLVLAFAGERDAADVVMADGSGNGINMSVISPPSLMRMDSGGGIGAPLGVLMPEVHDPAATAHHERIESYKLIFNMLAGMETLLMAQASTGKYPRLTIEQMQEIKSQMLKRALVSRDRLFHTCLYDWFIEMDYQKQLLQIESDFLEEYLKSNMDDEVRVNLLWRYYAHTNQFINAAKVLYEIAQRSGVGLVDRIEYLTKASTYAKSASHFDMSVDGTHAELFSQIHDELDVTRVQLEIYNRLETMPMETASIRRDLNTAHLGINELFHRYAKPYRMHDVTLSILHTSDYGVQSRPIAEMSWDAILSEAKDHAVQCHRSPFEAMSDRVRELGRRFYPDENVFPVRFIINWLEYESFMASGGGDENGNRGIGGLLGTAGHGGMDRGVGGDVRAYAPMRGWVITTLYDGVKIPYATLFHQYHDLFETKLPPWSSNDALVFLIKEIHALLVSWMDHVQALALSAIEREEFPARAVDEAVCKYLVMLRQDDRAVVAALHHLQTRLRRSF